MRQKMIKPVSQISKVLIGAIIIFFSLTFLFSAILQKPEQETISLNELAIKILNEEVAKIEIIGHTLNITLEDGSQLHSLKEPDVGLSETLKNYGVTPEAMQKTELLVRDQSGRNLWLGIIIPTLLPILAIVIIFWFIFRRASAGVNQAFTFGRANVHLFANFKERIAFKDVAGLKEAKQELEEVVDFLKNPQKFRKLGAKIPRGALLMGPPGSGKTLLARAVAGEAGVPFFHISASEFVEMFVGVGAARTRDAFATAKRAAPSILFIDEIDAIGRERGAGLGGGHDEREQTLNQILVEMDGFDRETNVIVLAATNRPDILDQALLRPGRFDRRIILDLPDINEREEILKIHSLDKPLEKDVDFKKVSVRTPGFSGADLANLINEAAIWAARQNKKIISQQDIYDSVEKVLLGPERRSRLISEKEKKITAYHEAGHALVAASLKDSDPIHKISIISRGRVGGYTLKLPIEEQRIKTRAQFMADLTVLLGGYTAEKNVFKDISTGAANDLKQVAKLARDLVTKFGMSEKFGPATFGDSEEMVFLGREIAAGKNYSEEVAALIDKEMQKIIDVAHKKAQKIIALYKPALKKLAEELLSKEILEQEEFYALIKPFKIEAIKV